MFKLFKPLIDPATRAKLHFISANEELLQFFDRDKLPVSLGGTNPFEPEGESIGKETLGLGCACAFCHPRCFNVSMMSMRTECNICNDDVTHPRPYSEVLAPSCCTETLPFTHPLVIR